MSTEPATGQADALRFEEFSKNAFGDAGPEKLVNADSKDIRNLIYLESAGLIEGASTSLTRSIPTDDNGYGFIFEDDLCIVFRGKKNTKISQRIIAVSPLGQELLALVPSRNAYESAKRVAFASRGDEIHECHIGIRAGGERVKFLELLWKKEVQEG